MQCPACGGTLSPLQVRTIMVDACQEGCGGIWLDNRELQKLDEPAEPAGAAVQVQAAPRRAVDTTRRRNCPVCPDTVMMQHYSSALHQVLVDECPGCGGYWLDAGELAQIRAEFETEAQRKQAAEALAAPVEAQMEAELARERARAQNMLLAATVLRRRM